MKICKIENCDNPSRKLKMCTKHYQQVCMFGHIKRTRFDPNKIIIKGNICEMYLYDNFGKYKMSTFFDIEFLEEVKNYKWGSDKNGNTFYVRTHKTQKHKSLKLHQLICPCKKGLEPGHIDGNGLNNRRSNLRSLTHRQNMEERKDNKSGYPGISWHKRAKKWRSQIIIDKKNIHLGLFDNSQEAFNEREKFKQEHNLK